MQSCLHLLPNTTKAHFNLQSDFHCKIVNRVLLGLTEN